MRGVVAVVGWLAGCAAPDAGSAGLSGEDPPADAAGSDGPAGGSPTSSAGTTTTPDTLAVSTADTGTAPWPVPARIPPGAWVALAPGVFDMGARADEACPMSGNDVRHRVTLTHDVEIGATEVTYGAFAEVTGARHSWDDGCDDCPVQMVTWHQAAATCNALSAYAALPACYLCPGPADDPQCVEVGDPYACAGYRLPTEAEWEYAARAGTDTSVYSGDLTVCGWNDPALDPIAWYLYSADGDTHEVATRAPNAWGLYDTAGNVWEWTHDGYVTDLSRVAATDPVVPSPDGLRVMKGGSYNCLPGEVRAAHRSGLPDAIAGLNVGVRCARTLP